jgi:hypothetical protein
MFLPQPSSFFDAHSIRCLSANARATLSRKEKWDK